MIGNLFLPPEETASSQDGLCSTQIITYGAVILEICLQAGFKSVLSIP